MLRLVLYDLLFNKMKTFDKLGIWRRNNRDDVGIVPYAGEVERRGRSASPNIKYVYADIHITLVRVANGCER